MSADTLKFTDSSVSNKSKHDAIEMLASSNTNKDNRGMDYLDVTRAICTITRLGWSQAFFNYVSHLFDMYQELGNDRIHTVPMIGVVSNLYVREHNAAVNTAMDFMATELEFYINALSKPPDSTNEDDVAITKLLNLETCVNIINCLSTMHFTLDDMTDTFDGIDRNNFITKLLRWVNRSDGEPRVERVERILSCTGKVYNSVVFWQLLNQLLLRGLFEQAILLIERSRISSDMEDVCSVTNEAIKSLLRLLENYPMDSAEDFRNWKSLVLNLKQEFDESNNNISKDLTGYLNETLLLLSGSHREILSYSKTWYEAFCGLFLFYIPSLKLTEEYLSMSTEKHPICVTNDWEQACVNIIKNDLYSIFLVLESLDNCTATFAAALCAAKGMIESPFALDDSSMRLDVEEDLFSQSNGIATFMLNNFALELCSYNQKSLWPITIGLITYSPTETTSAKKLAISELLLHYPFETNDDIEWLLSICAKWKLTDIARTIYMRLGRKMMDEGNSIEAISNFSKAGRFDLVTNYTWILFEASVLKDGPLDDIVLNGIISTQSVQLIPDEVMKAVMTGALRQSLAPYAVLFRFYEYRKSETWSEAFRLLMALVTFPFLPKSYLILLMCKFVYPMFLIDDTKKLQEDDIYALIEIMETRWDSSDERSRTFFEILRENETCLAENLQQTSIEIRKKLNIKLCLEYMSST